MAAVEVIYLVAATLWIGVVVAALCIGIRLVLKFRARRRRVNRFLDIVWIPVLLCTGVHSFLNPDSDVLSSSCRRWWNATRWHDLGTHYRIRRGP